MSAAACFVVEKPTMLMGEKQVASKEPECAWTDKLGIIGSWQTVPTRKKNM
jgi:hypothetical protein